MQVKKCEQASLLLLLGFLEIFCPIRSHKLDLCLASGLGVLASNARERHLLASSRFKSQEFIPPKQSLIFLQVFICSFFFAVGCTLLAVLRVDNVAEDVRQQRGRSLGKVPVQVEVQSRRGRRVQEVRGQEHPAGLGQELQAHGRLTLPLRPAGGASAAANFTFCSKHNLDHN